MPFDWLLLGGGLDEILVLSLNQSSSSPLERLKRDCKYEDTVLKIAVAENNHVLPLLLNYMRSVYNVAGLITPLWWRMVMMRSKAQHNGVT